MVLGGGALIHTYLCKRSCHFSETAISPAFAFVSAHTMATPGRTAPLTQLSPVKPSLSASGQSIEAIAYLEDHK
jgi:hypothetical protein